MDETLWHRYEPWWPIRRGEDGKLFVLRAAGAVWRRRYNGRWQYKQDEPTVDEWLDTQW